MNIFEFEVILVSGIISTIIVSITIAIYSIVIERNSHGYDDEKDSTQLKEEDYPLSKKEREELDKRLEEKYKDIEPPL